MVNSIVNVPLFKPLLFLQIQKSNLSFRVPAFPTNCSQRLLWGLAAWESTLGTILVERQLGRDWERK